MSEGNGKKLPKGWCRATIGDVAEYINGAAFKPTDWTTDGVPIIRIQNLTDPSKQPNRTHRKIDSRLLIRKGDLLFSWSATLDAFLWHGEDAWLNQHIFKVVPENPLSTRFVFYLLRFAVREITRSEHMHGSTMQHINRGPFLSHRIGIPPLAEQERIIDKLDELLSDLDAGVAALEGVQAKLKHYRATVLKAAVEGALTKQWRRDHPTTESAADLLTRILAERRRGWEEAQLRKFKDQGKEPPKNWKAKYQEPTALDTANLPKLPQGWCWASIDQLSVFVTSGSRGWAEYYSETGPLFVRSQDIRTDRLVMADVAHVMPPASSEGARTRLLRGDLLITITGANVAKAALVDCELVEAYVSQHVGMTRFVAPEVGAFIHTYTIAPSGGRKILLKVAYGAGKPGLNLDNLRELPIPLPPLAEQQAIVEQVEDQLSVIDHLEADLDAKLKSAQALRQSILRDAFEGKLVSQDPNDEPASELLGRIAAEREARAAAAKAAPSKRISKAARK